MYTVQCTVHCTHIACISPLWQALYSLLLVTCIISPWLELKWKLHLVIVSARICVNRIHWLCNPCVLCNATIPCGQGLFLLRRSNFAGVSNPSSETNQSSTIHISYQCWQFVWVVGIKLGFPACAAAMLLLSYPSTSELNPPTMLSLSTTTILMNTVWGKIAMKINMIWRCRIYLYPIFQIKINDVALLPPPPLLRVNPIILPPRLRQMSSGDGCKKYLAQSQEKWGSNLPSPIVSGGIGHPAWGVDIRI